MLTLLLTAAHAGTPAECMISAYDAVPEHELGNLAWEVVAYDQTGTVLDMGVYTDLRTARLEFVEWLPTGATFYVDLSQGAELYTLDVLACVAPDWPAWAVDVSGLLDVCRDVGGCL